MAITNGYTTLAIFKAYALPDTPSNAGDDAVIEAIIESTSRFIDDMTGRKFYTSANDETRYFTPTSPSKLYTGDLVSVTSLSIDIGGTRTYAYTLAASEYDLSPYNAALNGKTYNSIEIAPTSVYRFETLRKSAKVVGKFGWSAAPIEIAECCKDIANNVYRRRFGKATGTEQSTITAAGVVVTPRDLSDFSRSIIANYRVIV